MMPAALWVGDCDMSGGVANRLLVQPNVVWLGFIDSKLMAELNLIGCGV